MIVRAQSSHEPSQKITSAARTPLTKSLEWRLLPCIRAPRPRRRGGGVGMTAPLVPSVAVVLGVSSNMEGSSGAGDLHFLAQAVPDAAVEGGELGGETDLLDLARARQVDGDDVPDGGRAGGHHDHPVSQADGLGEVVGDEDDRSPCAGPQTQQLVL